ncbi:MAG TPA: hypothetical protein VGA04_01650 [Streptosporangiaceae bacterium]
MFKYFREPRGTAMGVVVTYVAYLTISVALTVFVGSALSRSGRVFLQDVFAGQAAPAQAVSRLLVVGFYLLNLGFVTLTMRMSGEIGSARQVIQVLSLKIGEVLLVLGALYLANISFLTRLRRRMQAQALQRVPPAPERPGHGLPQPRLPETVPPLSAAATPPRASPRDGRAADTTTADAQANWPGQPGQAEQAEQADLAHQAGQARQASPRDQGLWRPRPRQALH